MSTTLDSIYVDNIPVIESPDSELASPNGSRKSRKSKSKSVPIATTGVEVRKPTIDELAKYWIDKHAGVIFGLGEFRQYDKGVWTVIPDYQIDKSVKDLLIDTKSYGVKPSSMLIDSVKRFAMLDIRVDDSKFDANTDIIVCANGVLDVPTGNFRAHDPNDFASFALPYDFNPQAECPAWNFVIRQSDAEVVGLEQEYMGLCLTSETKHELALWFKGHPGSGKSTHVKGFQTVLGKKSGMLGLRDIEHSRFSLGDVQGKTLLVATEQPNDYMQATDVLNRIISGEQVTIERKFKNPVTIQPTAKILWAMNELPRVNDANDGLFRRVKVVEFKTIPESERRTELKGQIEGEGAGILNWALEGLRRLRARGNFEIPQCVKDATEEFKQFNDIAWLFVNEMAIRDEGMRTQAQLLHNSYQAWCYMNGYKAKTSTMIARDWKRLGFDKKPIQGKNYWLGIGLRVANAP